MAASLQTNFSLTSTVDWTMINTTSRNFTRTRYKNIMQGFDCKEINNFIKLYPISNSIINFRLANHYIALVICIMGMVGNTLLIAVLTRPKMRSPINIIMTGLAAADQAMMMTYGIYVVYFRIIFSPLKEIFESSHTSQWIYVSLYHYIYPFSHAMGEWLTLAIAIIRYMACKPRLPPRDLNKTQAKLVILTVGIGSLLICVPNFVYFDVDQNKRTACYKITQSDMVKSSKYFHDFWFWFVFLAYRLVPNSLLILFTGLILWELRKIAIQRRTTLGNRTSSEEILATKMLLSIAIFTVLTECPKIIVPLVYRFSFNASEHNSHANFLEKIESKLLKESVMSFLENFILLDSCVNFIIYCSMSRVFRVTFMTMFVSKHQADSGMSRMSQTTRTMVDNNSVELQAMIKAADHSPE